MLGDILVREVEAYEATIEKLRRLSDDGETDVYIGLEGSRMERGRLKVVYPEKEPPTRIVSFPKGTYLVSDTGTQPGGIDIPGKGFVQIYNRIIPFEFHGQKVYGRQINLERADVHVLNDASDILFDCYRTEGPGTALTGVNGGRTRVNLFNAGIGCKTAPQALFEPRDSELELTGAMPFGFNRDTECNVIVNGIRGGKTERLTWDDVKVVHGTHGRLTDSYATDGKRPLGHPESGYSQGCPIMIK